MKTFFISLLFVLCCSSTYADDVLKGYSYAVADIDEYGYFSWSKWYDCNIIIRINYDRNELYINSTRPQLYKIITSAKEFYDKDGVLTYEWKIVDQDNDRGTLRIRRNGQLYIIFNNIAWVYNFIIL